MTTTPETATPIGRRRQRLRDLLALRDRIDAEIDAESRALARIANATEAPRRALDDLGDDDLLPVHLRLPRKAFPADVAQGR